MLINHKKTYLEKLEDIDRMDKGLLRGVQVLRSEAYKLKYRSNGKDVVILNFKDTPETKQFFNKLKKVDTP